MKTADAGLLIKKVRLWRIILSRFFITPPLLFLNLFSNMFLAAPKTASPILYDCVFSRRMITQSVLMSIEKEYFNLR